MRFTKFDLSVYFYMIVLFGLSIYTYSQVDLNLTLINHPVYLSIQAYLIQLGYFRRPLSTLIYIVLLILMVYGYIRLIYQSNIKQVKVSKLIKIALIASIILLISYPAFSYDIFNYIFDARLWVEHGVNPYTHTALDFAGDDWTRFMRWTHRTYPYGPTWLPITIIFYYLGLGKFILTLISFKLLAWLSYWLGAWGIWVIVKKYVPKETNLALALYLFNPLILIEGLVSAHIDMVMAGVMLAGFGLVVSRSRVAGWLGILVSIGMKYVSGALVLPLLLFHRNRISYTQLVTYSVLLGYGLTLVVISQRELLPWYFLVPFSLTALMPKNRFCISLMMALIPATLVRYAPFLYIGDYTQQVILSRNMLTLVVGVVMFGFSYLNLRGRIK